jgi:hypothetical protein
VTAFEDWQPQRIAIAGDWHANVEHARKAIRYAKQQGAQAILHVGDTFYDMRENFDGSPNVLDKVNEALEEAGLLFGWVDGNHDRNDYLQELAIEHDYQPVQLRPNIYYLPRGFRWTWCGVSFLALGGAHSVDRPWRTPHVEWWPGETIGAGDALRACEGGRADVMVTHDVPDGVRIPSIEGNPLGFPERELEAAERNRRVLRSVVDVVQPRRLFAGHYHTRLTTELVGVDYKTRVDVLDMDGRAMGQNVAIVDVVSL